MSCAVMYCCPKLFVEQLFGDFRVVLRTHMWRYSRWVCVLFVLLFGDFGFRFLL